MEEMFENSQVLSSTLGTSKRLRTNSASSATQVEEDVVDEEEDDCDDYDFYRNLFWCS